MVTQQYLSRRYPGRFINLHVHSDRGSIKDALKIDYDKVSQLDEGMAITDHQTLFAVIQHYHEMKKRGKTPILGIELYTENLLNSATNSNIDYGHKKRYYHLVLLCKDIQGLFALYKIVSEAEDRKATENQKIPVTLNDILPYRQHFVCMSACLGGELPQYLKHNQIEYARKFVQTMKSYFGDDFYIEIQRHGIDDEAVVNPGLVGIAREQNVKLVATADSHYTNPEDKIAHNALYALEWKMKLNDPKPPGLPGDGYHLYLPSEAEAIFYDIPDALDNTIEIFEKCRNVEIPYPKGIEEYHFPKFPTPQGVSEAEYFKWLCHEGFKQRFEGTDTFNDPQYINRLNKEIEVILQLNFPGYFLLVWDMVNFCRTNGIWVGPGRGSVGGSLVAHCLGITNRIDPLEYDLLFERFLNGARKTAPDIDLDFESGRRGEVFDYLRRTYGEDCTAQIITFGVMKAKGAVADSTKVLDFPYSLGQSISKLIPNNPDITLSEALKTSQMLQNMYSSDLRVKSIIDLAMKLEGTIRQRSTHAAGFVVTDQHISSYIPTAKVLNTDDNKLIKVTQFTMLDVEAFGLLKIDVLGLGTLDQLKDCEGLINQSRLKVGQNPISIGQVPLNDPNVYRNILGQGKTFGIFQISSNDMKGLMRKLFSNSTSSGEQLFEDLIAGISLNRPGPMKSIPKFLQNRLNPNAIQYDHEKLIPILKSTHGTLVYQEQVSLIAQVLAGYSPEQADILRRAISKKNEELLQAQRGPFVYGTVDNFGNIILPGCIRNGVDERIALKIFDDIVDFCKYAFNKSHGASYGVLSAEGAWAKYYYPTEFMASLLNSAALGSNNSKLPLTLAECENMGIKVLPPDINKSEALFSIEGPGVIRYGLAAIKKLGYSTVKKIVEHRNQEGAFETYPELVIRLKSKSLIKKDSLEALIYSGALDCFSGSKKAKIDSIESILTGAKQGFSYLESLIPGLVGNIETKDEEDFDDLFKMQKERDYLGAFITANPLNNYQQLINSGAVDLISSVIPNYEDGDNAQSINNYPDGTTVKILGYVLDVQIRQGKRRQFLTFEVADLTGTIKGTAGIEYIDVLQKGNIVYLTAPIEHKESFGTQLSFSKVSSVLRRGQNLTTDMITLKRDSMVVAYVSNLNDIEKFASLTSIQNMSSNVSLYFACLETGRKFAFNQRISLQDQRVLDILRTNSEYVVIR